MIVGLSMLIQIIWGNTYVLWHTFLARHRINLSAFVLHRLGLLGKLLSQQPCVTHGMLPGFAYDFWESRWVVRKGWMKVYGEKPHTINIKLQREVILLLWETSAAHGFNRERHQNGINGARKWQLYNRGSSKQREQPFPILLTPSWPAKFTSGVLPSMENVPVLDPVACYLFVRIVLAESLWTFQKTPKLTSAETNRSHCCSHTHSPACSSHIITNILFVTKGRYLSATCLLRSSACCDSPFSTDFIQLLQHCNLLTFLFYNALYIQYSF